ncbi:DUF1566 domain-containing protein [Colwellia demingiae]|uniref:DUF1566 domain-containing protein n=1 Tax=Colwellia demingiae TaxID=89401 RepID=A0A5C6Q451_9GAMM|nr:DUF1566 domain-containing protein [Colwellia demingiae]TWX63427.1 DUF1566 domain-containing protein [Colwellia demingiae]
MNIKNNLTFIFQSFLITSFASSLAYGATCPANIEKTTPDAQFSDNNDGTVTDTKTKLMWARCAVGVNYDIASSPTCQDTNGFTPSNTKNWKQAFKLATQSTLAGHGDWRLPNIKELQSLVERACYSPAINDTVFSVVNSPGGTPAALDVAYWTSTPVVEDNDSAWVVNFSNGSSAIKQKDGDYSVRFVRNITP